MQNLDGGVLVVLIVVVCPVEWWSVSGYDCGGVWECAVRCGIGADWKCHSGYELTVLWN